MIHISDIGIVPDTLARTGNEKEDNPGKIVDRRCCNMCH